MRTKLTLKIDREVIQIAKAFVRKQNVSLSFLVENLLRKVTASNPPAAVLANSLVAQLSGVIQLSVDFDYRKKLGDRWSEKYQ